MEKIKFSDGELKANNVEKEYLDSLSNISQVSYNFNDVKLYSGKNKKDSSYRKKLAYIKELWANIKPSSDMDETKKEKIERKKVLMDPIKLEEYYKLLEILVNSKVISKKELTTNKKILIKVNK